MPFFQHIRQFRPRRALSTAIPRGALLRRKITQGLAIELHGGALVAGKGIILHQQVVGGGKTPVTLGAELLEKFRFRRGDRRRRRMSYVPFLGRKIAIGLLCPDFRVAFGAIKNRRYTASFSGAK